MKRLLSLLVVLALLASPVSAAQTLQLAVGTLTTALTTEMNSIGNNGWTTASGVIDNRITQTMNGYLLCRVIVHVVFVTTNPNTGGAVTGWFLKNHDPTTPLYETTPTASIGQNRVPDFVIPVVTGQLTTDVSVDVRCPAERFKVVVQNTASGQTWAATLNTLKLLPITIQGN
jgi:hypothetical protein